MPIDISCFKAYDVRGRIPDQLNEEIVYRIANATAEFLAAKTMVVGHDIRETSPAMVAAVVNGLTDAGVNVLDIGLGGTEMVYFAVGHLGADGGMMVTASHNPKDYNGLKIVRDQARPISEDTGLADIRLLAQADERRIVSDRGAVDRIDISEPYLSRLLEFVEVDKLKPLTLVADAGNGGAGLVVDQLEPRLPFRFVKINNKPDGSFPNGVPNPLLEDNRQRTADPVVGAGADFGIAWDGDFDRCFFFDESGRFIEGYYVVGLLAESVLKASAGEAIVYDPRVIWNTIDVVEANGGRPVQSKSGHSFMKVVMRECDAAYGGEMSAHHYFRDFFYCDSGMVPWLLIAQLVSKSGVSLGNLVEARMKAFPSSGELNYEVRDAKATISLVKQKYASQALRVDTTDGIGIDFENWRFNLRASNTEPVIRLNVEARGDANLLQQKTKELVSLIESQA